MEFLNGIKNLLLLVNESWAIIIVIIGLVFSISKKVKEYFSKSEEEQIAIIKKQIEETMLRLVTDAEKDYRQWMQAGEIKRSQVIEEIFLMYPILSKVTNQEELIQWIDNTINEALKTMRDVCAINAKQVYGVESVNEKDIFDEIDIVSL